MKGLTQFVFVLAAFFAAIINPNPVLAQTATPAPATTPPAQPTAADYLKSAGAKLGVKQDCTSGCTPLSSEQLLDEMATRVSATATSGADAAKKVRGLAAALADLKKADEAAGKRIDGIDQLMAKLVDAIGVLQQGLRNGCWQLSSDDARLKCLGMESEAKVHEVDVVFVPSFERLVGKQYVKREVDAHGNGTTEPALPPEALAKLINENPGLLQLPPGEYRRGATETLPALVIDTREPGPNPFEDVVTWKAYLIAGLSGAAGGALIGWGLGEAIQPEEEHRNRAGRVEDTTASGGGMGAAIGAGSGALLALGITALVDAFTD